MKILVTGGTGFVGRELLSRLLSDGCEVRAAVRGDSGDLDARVQTFRVGDLGAAPNYLAALRASDAVIHLAARVHVMNDSAAGPLAEFRRVNVTGTLNLARQALDAGVPRFVFLSSIKVNGEETPTGRPFTASDTPHPVDPYGVSKLEAEQGLQHLTQGSGMRLAIVRTPLVYGPGVKANFLQLMRWVHRGVPLPLGAVTGNRRSFIALGNLVDLLVTCAKRDIDGGEVFLASDGEDLSTRDLLQRLGAALGRPPRLVSVPPALLAILGRALGRGAQVQRLLGSLQVDASDTRRRLSWSPPLSVDDGLLRTAATFLAGART